jgi:thiol-disulfide isomerase/thioredoxin
LRELVIFKKRLAASKYMNKKTKKIIFWIVGVSIFAFLIWQFAAYQRSPGKYDSFARCLKERGAVFYGAFWCPHCQNQKLMFGKSAKLLPYVECSTPDGQGQLQICRDKNITSYPTWEFTDGSRLSGEIPLSQLAEKTGCPLP